MTIVNTTVTPTGRPVAVPAFKAASSGSSTPIVGAALVGALLLGGAGFYFHSKSKGDVAAASTEVEQGSIELTDTFEASAGSVNPASDITHGDIADGCEAGSVSA